MQTRDKIDFLSRQESYPERTGAVEVVETHMSWVFLTDTHAYKLKKPVRYPFLDFRTIDSRHLDCLEEVRLNRRLAGDVYLGVVPLSGSPGNFRLGGDGQAVDWLVRMRRLPSARMLDRLLVSGQAGPGQLRAAGHLLGRFYRQRRPVEIAADEYRRCLRDEIEENSVELSQGPGLPSERITALCERQRRFLDSARALLDRRVDRGRIVEGHGDLRPEHLCLTDPPVIIDCLEFKRQFRILDPADELAYLGMECERLGAGWAGPELLGAYGEITADHPPMELVHFHASVRAMLRAKLALWHTRDHDIGEPQRWIRKALSYIEAAQTHAGRF